MFPPKLIDNCIKSYLDNKFTNSDRGDTNTDEDNTLKEETFPSGKIRELANFGFFARIIFCEFML